MKPEKILEFWNQPSKALKQNGFSAAQIKKLQEAFCYLVAAGQLRLSQDHLLTVVNIDLQKLEL